MLIELKGDLLKSDCNVLIHCANCFHTMGAGIAKAIAIRYPEAKEADLMTGYGDRGKLGSYSVSESAEGILVFNIYGQYRYGVKSRQVDYRAIETSLKEVADYLDRTGMSAFHKIGTYQLGCNRAGGDWSIVKDIISASFPSQDIYIYSL